MSSLIDLVAKRLNWSRRHWSTARDRAFHDSLFASQTHDPFSDSYPGYLTIRRFADLAEAHVRPGELVLDLGCGPGEITCELARRQPGVQFLGVDHSSEAVSRGSELAAGLGLTNIRFELHDLEQYRPPAGIGLVTMFDAFHHVLDPARFIERVGTASDRFFLIEPSGGRMGEWQRTVDLDWLAESLFTIRDRLEYQFDAEPPAGNGSMPVEPEGEPTEHRYSLEDFQRFFAGFGLDVRGTIAGLERYGTSPHAKSPIRDEIGRSLYNLMVDLESGLRRRDLDLAAKHWAIYAERGRTFPARAIPSVPQRDVEKPLVGPYDAEYSGYEGPSEAKAGTEVGAAVRVANRSWKVWDSADDRPVFLSYHWLDEKGIAVIEDGLRSPLPRPISPGETATVAFRIQCPDAPGRYTLSVDLVHEQVTWFSRGGVPMLQVPFRIA